MQKLSATDVLSCVGRLLVYTFVQSSIIKVIKYSFSIASFTTSCNNSELFFAELIISRLTERCSVAGRTKLPDPFDSGNTRGNFFSQFLDMTAPCKDCINEYT